MPTSDIDPERATSVLDAFVAARSADLDWMTTLLDAFARARAEHEVQE